MGTEEDAAEEEDTAEAAAEEVDEEEEAAAVAAVAEEADLCTRQMHEMLPLFAALVEMEGLGKEDFINAVQDEELVDISMHAKLVHLFTALLENRDMCRKVVAAWRAFDGANGREREGEFREVDNATLAYALNLTPSDKAELERTTPPQDSKRFLYNAIRKKGLDLNGILIQTTLEVKLKGRRYTAESSVLKMDEMLKGFLESDARDQGPFYPDVGNCEALRNCGTRMAELRKAYVKRFPGTANDLIVFVSLETDGTTKNKTSLQPVYVTLPQYDPFAKVQNIAQSFILVGWLVTGDLVRVFDAKTGVKVAISSVPDADRRVALSELKRLGMAQVLQSMADVDIEGPVRLRPGGEFGDKAIRIVHYLHHADLPELYSMLGVTQNYLKTCPFCWGFGHTGSELRDTLKELEMTDEERKQVGLRERAFPYHTHLFFQDDNVYNNFTTDMLHIVEGVLTMAYDLFAVLMGKEKRFAFLALSQSYGNVVFGSSAVSGHKNEECTKSFQGVVLALLTLRQSNPTHRNLALCCETACLLMETVIIAKDDSVGLLLERLEVTTARLRALYDDGLFRSTKFNPYTIKLHIWLNHLTHHAKANGCVKGFSTAAGETAHGDTWDLFRRGVHTSAGMKQLLLDSRIKLALNEAMRKFLKQRRAEPVPQVLWTMPWSPAVRVVFSRSQTCPRADLLRYVQVMLDHRRMQLGFESVVEGMEGLEKQLESTVEFSTAASMGIYCKTRQVDIKRPNMLKAGENSVLAYSRGKARERGPNHKCNNPGCLHHAQLEMFTSMANEADTVHGIPLMFVRAKGKVCAVVLQLEPVYVANDCEHLVAVLLKVKPALALVSPNRFRGVCKMHVRAPRVWVLRPRRLHDM